MIIAKKSDYRKFRIKSVQGPNDYASMEEVLTRRFTHESNGEFDSFSRMPDLLLMDGGRGQVNIALGVLEKLGIQIPVCGMVKDDHHRTRGLYFNNVEIPIETNSEPNDYASMEEVLTRRFTHESNGEFDSFSRMPDLLLMDGGRGQVNIALGVLEKLGIQIPVCGMVKDDHHRTRGLYFNNVEIPIETNSEGFRLITRIQDEAHRFAIEYHRSLRSKEQVHSILDDIPGIGERRRKALMRKFRSVEEIRDASLEELTETESMNAASAQQVYNFFHVHAQSKDGR